MRAHSAVSAHVSIRGKDVQSECEGSQPVMDAMADARVRVVISVPGALWKRARYAALIGPTVAVLFATVQL